MMIYVKVINYIDRGLADYKGMDIDSIVPGTQVYDDLGVRCVVGYHGAIPDNADLEVLTESEYLAEREDIIANIPPGLDPLEQMKIEVEKLKAAKEQAEADSINNMLALTELYEMNLTLRAELDALKGGPA